MKSGDILGRWTIESWRQDYDDGRVVHPFGQRISGFIQYDPDNTMVLLLTAGERLSFKTGGQWNAEDAEKAQAYSTCLSYAGAFEVVGEEIHHHVHISLFPNWVDGVQRRKARLQDGRLELIARIEEGTSEARTAILSWRRSSTGRVT